MKHRKRRPICIVRHDYYPDGHVSRDAEALVEAGYDVSVVALRRPTQPFIATVNGARIYRLPVEHHRGSALRYAWEYLSFFILASAMVAILHLRKRFQVVEVDNMPDVLVFTALFPRLTGARVLFYIFDYMKFLLVVVRGYSKWHPVVQVVALLERVSAAFADRVVMTHELARPMVEGRGVPSNKLSVVLNCPNEAMFDHRLPIVSERRDGTFTIVTHGLIAERFGIQILIDALPELARRIPGVRLEVFGEGEYRAELEARARRNGVAERVIFHGLVPQEQLSARLRACDVGYVGMLCDLMLSNKLMEYAALGLPVVLARWSIYEHYFPEDSATYFEAGDARSVAGAILAVYKDPEIARRKAERARERYLGYRWSVQREVYLGIYADLVNGVSQGPAKSRSEAL